MHVGLAGMSKIMHVGLAGMSKIMHVGLARLFLLLVLTSEVYTN